MGYCAAVHCLIGYGWLVDWIFTVMVVVITRAFVKGAVGTCPALIRSPYVAVDLLFWAPFPAVSHRCKETILLQL